MPGLENTRLLEHSGIDDRSSLSVSMPQELDFSFPVALNEWSVMKRKSVSHSAYVFING